MALRHGQMSIRREFDYKTKIAYDSIVFIKEIKLD